MQNRIQCARHRARSRISLPRLATFFLLLGVAACSDEPSGPTTGSLSVAIGGLPAGAQGAVTVTGPSASGYSRVLSSSESLSGLKPGSYTVAAADITQGGMRYAPSPASQTVSVVAGRDTSSASVSYAISSGALTVNIGGVPQGTTPSVSVTGPNGFSAQLSSSETLMTLEPGTYSVTANQVVAAAAGGGGHVYSATPLSQAVSVQPSETPRAVNVNYTLITGALDVTINGLPAGSEAAVTVSGPGGFSRPLTASSNLVGLFPGTYTVSAANVTVSGASYTPNPATASHDVSASITARQATVTYAPVGIAPPPAFNLLIDGMYVTQVVQTYAGTVPLVAGRPGFLRVFVKSTTANAAQPSVRVRLYQGAALAQTLTLTAPQANVPTDISEGTLTSSWNVSIPASLIQPGLRILADVDPANAIQEANESDNSFPVDGTPIAPPVQTTAPLNLFFVPVQYSSNGVTGRVNDTNQDQFLTFARKVLPIRDIVATVHAPYVTSTPPVESNNSSAWTSILSEVNALRVAEGSADYYMGVVGVSYTSGIAGYGYAPGRATVTWDLLPSAAPISAHELSHNLGRYHAPCGGPSGVDANYPYPLGIIGVYGYDVALNVLKPTNTSDLMGYCGYGWISDYTYVGILNYRASTVNAAFAPNVSSSGSARLAPVNTEASVQSPAIRPSLVVWGRIENGKPVLEPAFAARTRTVLPSRPGPYRIEARATDGRVVFAYSFEGDEPADLTDRSMRQFAFAVPVDAAMAQSIARIRLTTESGASTELRVAGSQIVSADPVEATIPRAGQVALRLRDPAARMAVVRDRATGQILAFVRGTTVLRSAASEFDVEVSDGVRSVARTVRAVRR